MKKNKLWSIVLLAFLTLISAKVWAQDQTVGGGDQATSGVVSESEIVALNNRLDAIEKGDAWGLRVDALLQFWYTHDSWGTQTAGTSDYSSSKNQWDSFSFKRLNVYLTGKIQGELPVDYELNLDPSQASFNGIGGTGGTELEYDASKSTTTITAVNPFTLVKDAYAKLEFSPDLQVIVGQNKFAQGLEGRTSTRDLDFNNYSNVDGNGFGNKRDTGVQVVGEGIPLGPLRGEYAISLISGAGQSAWDNDAAKDLAARVGLTYEKNLFVGISGYNGTEEHGVRQDIGLESSWLYNGVKIQGEFLTGSVNSADNNSANNSVWTPTIYTQNGSSIGIPTGQIHPTGYYLLASYRLGDWRLGARWDGYNYNQVGTTGGSNIEYDTVTLGLDWFEDKDALKESLNWEDHLLGADSEGYQIVTIQSQVYI